ncbi:MAG TPA: replication-relaxation family protein [Bryobacteraceae bacterium]|nr:replication-relaxation family protein [Bryobacteraceae bacterium]
MASTNFQFNDRDAEIVHYVYQLRMASLAHLAALTNRSHKTLERRVPKLRDGRYLVRLKPPPHKGLYTIGPAGVQVLIEHGYAPAGLRNHRLRHQELRDIGIRHTLFVADIHTRLLLLTRGGPVTITHWQEGPSLWDTVDAIDEEATLPVRPDAYFVLTPATQPEGKGTVHVFLEADRSTMAHSRMATKIGAYLAYHHSRRYAKKYPPMHSFIVATVTQTRSRADELRRDLQPFIPRTAQAAYRFIPFDDLTLTSLVPSLSPASAQSH